MLLQQAAEQAKDFTHLVEGAGLVLAYAATKLFERRKGKKSDHEHHASQTRIENGIAAVQRDVKGLSTEVSGLKAEVRSTRELVIGFDGQNGLRGDLRDVEERVAEIEKRELDNARRIS